MFRRSFTHSHLLLFIAGLIVLSFAFNLNDTIQQVTIIGGITFALLLYIFSIIRRDHSPVRQYFVRNLTPVEISVLREELNQYLFSKFFFLLYFGVCIVVAVITAYKLIYSSSTKYYDPSIKNWMSWTGSFFLSSLVPAWKYQQISEINRDIKYGLYRVEGNAYKNSYWSRGVHYKKLNIGKYQFSINNEKNDPKTESIFDELKGGEQIFVEYFYGTRRIYNVGKIDSA